MVARDKVIEIVNEFLKNINVDSDTEQISELFAKEHTLFANELFDYIEILPGVAGFF